MADALTGLLSTVQESLTDAKPALTTKLKPFDYEPMRYAQFLFALANLHFLLLALQK